jgi:hypothetical protein
VKRFGWRVLDNPTINLSRLAFHGSLERLFPQPADPHDSVRRAAARKRVPREAYLASDETATLFPSCASRFPNDTSRVFPLVQTPLMEGPGPTEEGIVRYAVPYYYLQYLSDFHRVSIDAPDQRSAAGGRTDRATHMKNRPH